MKLSAVWVMAALVPAAAAQPADLDAVIPSDQIRDAFSVSDWSIQRLNVPDAEPAPVDVDVALDGVTRRLHLAPHSLRSTDFTVHVETSPGVFVTEAPPAPRTYRGYVEGMEDAAVAASILDGRLYAVVDRGHGDVWAVQPLVDTFEHAPADAHLVFHSSDLIAIDGVCGNEDLAEFVGGFPIENPGVLSAEFGTEIAADADNLYYALNGRSIPNTVADVENIINRVSVIYEATGEICYKITEIIVRSSGDPPRYNSNDPQTLLNSFQAEWNASHGGITRDTAHMFTGRDLNGNVIGIARGFNLICNIGSSYALSQARFTGNLLFRTGLVAHELGHLWGAQHCDSFGNCRIMCSGIGGCTGILDSFGPNSTNSILNHRNTRTCLGRCGGESPVPCNWIKKLTGKCKGDTIKGKVILWTNEFNGATMFLEVDGKPEQVVISGKKGKYISFPFDPGRYLVEIVDPPDCGFSKNVSCN
ncbi:MAG: hypothetical protein C4547_05585 [Phycisphaerales bacterium]|nr:MAG: hypothetical protein C4547_05585 [Phycisphaerales bacterium]